LLFCYGHALIAWFSQNSFGPTPQMWLSIKETAWHYWIGCKLLVNNISISSELLSKSLKGHALTRREDRLRKFSRALLFPVLNQQKNSSLLKLLCNFLGFFSSYSEANNG
jgi:hypothetical protein